MVSRYGVSKIFSESHLPLQHQLLSSLYNSSVDKGKILKIKSLVKESTTFTYQSVKCRRYVFVYLNFKRKSLTHGRLANKISTHQMVSL